MMTISLSNGGQAMVDDADYEYLSRWRWHRHPGGYAARTSHSGKVLMHREVAQPAAGLEVDHINRDKLDNRRANLRCVTHAANERNKPAQARNTSGHKGVCWDKARSKWVAKTRHEGRDVHLGRFDEIADAVAAYQAFTDRLAVVPQVAEHIGRLVMAGVR